MYTLRRRESRPDIPVGAIQIYGSASAAGAGERNGRSGVVVYQSACARKRNARRKRRAKKASPVLPEIPTSNLDGAPVLSVVDSLV